MEPERITLIVIVSTIVVLILVIAVIVLFSVFQSIKNRVLLNNETLRSIIKDKLPNFKLE